MRRRFEHLQILDLLHVRRGAAVIPKNRSCRRRTACAKSAANCVLLEPEQLANAAVMPISARPAQEWTRFGVLVREATQHTARRLGRQHFRDAIDRVFTVSGAAPS